MSKTAGWTTVAVLLAGLSMPALAWGPVTQVAVVSTAVHVLSQNGAIPLMKLGRYVREGARVSDQAQAELFPNFEWDPVGTLQSEMYLLQAVRGDRVDPYYAYRLGLLGKMVARATAPLAGGNPPYRRAYFADVERHIANTEMRMSKRLHVDPQAYFTRVRHEAGARDDTLVKDYQTGIGFSGLARAALSIDASRSVGAVADTWYTVLSSNVAYSNISVSNMRAYSLSALKFYLERENLAEARAMYDHIASMELMTWDIREKVGDMFFEAGLSERAMAEYEAVLAERPGYRPVMEKVALYYEQVGDEALRSQRLESAQEAFTSALAADKLHPNVSRKLLRAESLIVARDGRLAETRSAIHAARDLEMKAEGEALDRNFARAVVHFREAEEQYRLATEEFADEAKQATLGLRNVSLRMKELKGELIRNAQSLSGSGFARDARRLAHAAQDVNEEALKALLKSEFRDAVRGLEEELRSTLGRRP